MLTMKSKVLPCLGALLTVAVLAATTVAEDANKGAKEAGPTAPICP
jgi:hypothetical protein